VTVDLEIIALSLSLEQLGSAASASAKEKAHFGPDRLSSRAGVAALEQPWEH